ncbi:MAG: acyltransferase [Chitinophagaceae bacterium]|nr:MAG: acyltransferase [Chitinophagaceae bacterium]
MKNKLVKLEALRGFAAIYVVFTHTFKTLKLGSLNLSVLLRFGQEAVILFFLLSGFVIYYSFAKAKDKSFPLFLTKRFMRIYIPLIFAYILNYLFKWHQLGSLPEINTWNFVGNLLMLQDMSALKTNVFTDPFLGNQPLWSLSYEWWFYMIFFAIITRFKPKASLIAYSIGIIAALSYIAYPFFANRFVMYLVLWWAGADMARVYLEQRVINFQTLMMPLAAIAICTGILALNAIVNLDAISNELGQKSIGISPFLEVRHFAFTLVVICAAITWKKLEWIGWDFTFAPFEHLANISFGVYILHFFMISDATYLSFIDNAFIRYTLYFLICFATAFVIERMIYPPLNAWIISRLKVGGFVRAAYAKIFAFRK